MDLLAEKRINELYSNLLINADFEKLELMRNQPNIFEILGITRYEIRHSHFLAWLLNPKGSHGIGDYFLKRFLLDIFQDGRTNLEEFNYLGKLDILSVHNLLRETIIVHREKHNIDILIEFEKTIIVVENKIDAAESRDQLLRYKDSVLKSFSNKKPIFVYLTKYGNQSTLEDFYIECSYQKNILNYLNDLIQYRSESIQDHILTYLKDYIDNLNNNIMQKSQANVLAEKIYRQHQELFDFILENKPDYIKEFGILLTDFFEGKGYVIGSEQRGFVRFTTEKLANLFSSIQTNKIPWDKCEPFLFEIYFNQKGKFSFIATTSSSNDIVKNRLNQILETIPDHSRKDIGGWSNFFKYPIKRDPIKNILVKSPEEINQIFENLFIDISPKISQIESVIVAQFINEIV